MKEKAQRVSLYPKTRRVGSQLGGYTVTEKLDGSNLGIGKIEGKLFIAQRNRTYLVEDIHEPEVRQLILGGLHPWIEEHLDYLTEHLNEGSIMFGEWIKMGRIKYGENLPGNHKYYMFAKANLAGSNHKDKPRDLSDVTGIKNLYYDDELFKYVFDNQEIPDFIGEVPTIMHYLNDPTIEELDRLYDKYCLEQGRDVEGFVVRKNDQIRKYVRNKGGKVEPHRG